MTFLLMPLVPLRCCHVFDHTGTASREVPLRWSGLLVARAMLRPWLRLAAGVGAFMTFAMGFAVAHSMASRQHWSGPPNPFLFFGLMSLLPLGLGGLWWFRRRDRPARDLRLLMGRHVMGTSDPATWRPEVVRSADVASLIGSTDVAGTAEAALRDGHYSRAMLAARLLVARGEPLGEVLTARILSDAGAQRQLERTRGQPWRLQELAPRARPASPAPAVAEGILFYDNRRYPSSALDAVGGPGFAAFVRDNPQVDRAAPSHIVARVMAWAALVLFLWVGLSPPRSSDPDDTPAKRALGTGLCCLFIGWLLNDFHRRRVVIGGGKLRVAGQTALLDAVQNVGRRRFLVFPIVSVGTVGAQIEWPYRAGESEELERILNAAIRLRGSAALGSPAIRSAGRGLHVG